MIIKFLYGLVNGDYLLIGKWIDGVVTTVEYSKIYNGKYILCENWLYKIPTEKQIRNLRNKYGSCDFLCQWIGKNTK